MSTLEHLSDTALVARMARGDNQALQAFYMRVGHLAYGLAIEVTRDPEIAQKIVCGAFVEIWQRAGDAGPPVDPHGQLLHAIHRRAVDVVRASGQPNRSESVGITQSRCVTRESQSVQNLLNQLPDLDREALELAYYSGYSRHRIAARQDTSVEIVTSRLSNGLKRFDELQREAAPDREEAATPIAGRPAAPPPG